jgi:LuxR family maltose regulon positive regulatory protein
MPRSPSQLAKLMRPRLHNAVARERLFELLDDAREQRPVICVVGPPGAGKTTLVASWLDARSIKGIWYQVDEGDAALATLFHYLGTAVRDFTRRGQRPLPALTAEYLPDVAGFARRFFRELFSRLSHRATLVLDNYQEIEADHGFHRIVADAVNEIPAGTTLIVISRRDPPDCYSRLVANENVALVEWEDLKLTLDEAQAIGGVRPESNLPLIRALHEDCGGWAAGFTLMLERALRGRQAPQVTRPESLRAVFDYFAGELFGRLPAESRPLLLALSVLPRMSEAAAQAVTGTSAAIRLLEDLHRRRLFTDRRLAAQPVYQFHALFLAFLQDRATQLLDAVELAALNRRAVQALLRDGSVEEALPLYLEARAFRDARGVILAHAAELVGQGRWEVVVQWIGSLPGDLVRSDCWLLYWLGTARISVAPSEAREQLERSYDQALGKRDALCEIQAAAGIVQTYMFEYARFRPLDRWMEAIHEGLQRVLEFPSIDAEARAQSAFLAAVSHRHPDDTRIDACVGRVFELLPRVSDVNLRVTSAAYLLLWGTHGGPIEVAARSAPLLESCVREPGVTALNAAWAWLLISWYHCLVSNQRECCEALSVIEAIAEKEGLPMVRKFSALIGSWTEMHVCNIGKAQTWHAQLIRTIDPSSLFDKASVEGIEAWLAVLRNEPRAALTHGKSAAEWHDASGCTVLQANHRVSCIWANVLLRDFTEARRWIAETRAFLSRTRSVWQEVVLRATEAYIALENGNREEAHERLRAAFGYARESGYHYSLGQHLRPWMSRLSAAALEAGIEVEYVRSQIRKFGWEVPASRPANWPWRVTVYTLGRFELLIDGEPFSFAHKAPRKPLALLKALIAMGGSRVSEHRLIDALWPDEEGDRGAEAIEIGLRRLRQVLRAPEAVVVSEGTVSLDRGLVWFDSEAFEDLTATGTDTREMRRGLDLYRGEFLAEDAEAPWTVSARERLRRKFVNIVDLSGRRLELEQSWADAAALYVRGLDSDPLAEVFYQGLMRCHLATRCKAEGLSVFRRMRQTLSVTLGITPSPESERMYRALLES